MSVPPCARCGHGDEQHTAYRCTACLSCYGYLEPNAKNCGRCGHVKAKHDDDPDGFCGSPCDCNRYVAPAEQKPISTPDFKAIATKECGTCPTPKDPQVACVDCFEMALRGVYNAGLEVAVKAVNAQLKKAELAARGWEIEAKAMRHRRDALSKRLIEVETERDQFRRLHKGDDK